MLKFLKFLLGFFSITLLIILVNVSFFGGQNIKDENLNIFSEVSYSGGLKNKINFIDNIYTKNKDDFEIEDINNIIKIHLKSGVFILDLNDLTKEYIINGNGFKINMKSTGGLFVSNIGTNVNILSFDSSVLINFLDKNGKIINSYINYPHEYIKFDTNLNYVFKGVDLFRIRTTTKNGYIQNKSNFYSFVGEKYKFLLKDYLNFKEKSYLNNNENYKKIIKLEYSSFPFSQFINKYKNYLINDSKKAIFIQNNIYNSVIDLYNKKNIDSNLILNINSSLNELKSLDASRYKESLKFIDNIFKTIITKNIVIYNSQIENFTLLKNRNSKFLNSKNFLNLSKIYFVYDNINTNNFKKFFKNYLNTFLKNIGINEKNENFTLNSNILIFEVESFTFFMQEYIKYHLFINDINDFGIEVDILEKYIEFNKMIYFSGKIDLIKIETSLNQNIELLNKLEKYLRYKFFNEQRDISSNLLTLKDKNIVKFEDIKKFEKQVNILFDLFYKNKKTSKEYDSLKLKFSEEFLAIKNYEEYKLKYDHILKELYALEGLGVKTSKIYNISYVYNFLSKFKGIYFNKNDISKNGNYFNIDNVIINNKNYVFHLFPSLGNKLDILHDGKIFSYNLNEIELLFKEKFKGSKNEDKSKYNFNNFFIEKFKDIEDIKKDINLKELCALKNMIVDSDGKCILPEIDSDVISVFKKNKLLKEEFNIIKDFFPIKYNNILVKLNSGIYNININNVIVNIYIKRSDNNDKDYKISFNSKYDFKNHLFYNVNYKINEGDNSLFNGANFYIKYKKININKLKNILESKLENIDYIKKIYFIIDSKIKINNLKIEDIFGKIYLKFQTNNKNVIIKVEKDKILSIIVGNINILENSIDINNLKNYLDKIK